MGPMALARTTSGPDGGPDGPALVLAHGFTQNAKCWGRFGDLLAERHQIVAIDAPGHGRSPAVHDHADLPTAGRLLAEAGGPGVYVGYSMGGRMALHTALDPVCASAVQALVLVGATPGLPTAAERADRRTADDALAADLERIGLGAFLDRWLALPLFAGLPPASAARDERMTNRADGLTASLRRCGTGCQEPLWDRLGGIDVPVLVVAGSRDTKFCDIGRRMAEAIGANARFEVVADAGHAAHAERPDIVSALITSFVDGIGPSA